MNHHSYVVCDTYVRKMLRTFPRGDVWGRECGEKRILKTSNSQFPLLPLSVLQHATCITDHFFLKASFCASALSATYVTSNFEKKRCEGGEGNEIEKACASVRSMYTMGMHNRESGVKEIFAPKGGGKQTATIFLDMQQIPCREFRFLLDFVR